jgi:hypothetical protein
VKSSGFSRNAQLRSYLTTRLNLSDPRVFSPRCKFYASDTPVLSEVTKCAVYSTRCHRFISRAATKLEQLKLSYELTVCGWVHSDRSSSSSVSTLNYGWGGGEWETVVVMHLNVRNLGTKCVPWLRRLVAGLWPWSPKFDPRPVDVEFLCEVLSVSFHQRSILMSHSYITNAV